MKDHFSVSRRRKPKLKLVCSFNGTFQPRPSSGKLRYAGGETRIVSVDRNIGFFRLKSKFLELFPCPNGSRSFSLVYHLPDAAAKSGGGEGDADAPLVLITCDDDVVCMIQEYEKLESSGTHPRLWVFVCHDNAFGNVIDKSCVELGRNLKACLGGTELNSNNHNNCKVKKQVVVNRGGGVRASDDSLRKIVLKQQLLVKQSVKPPEGLSTPVSKSNDCRLGFEETEVECDYEMNGSFNLEGNLSSETEAPTPALAVSNETRNPDYMMDSHRMDTLDGENCGGRGHFPVAHSHPLNPTDFNVRKESGVPLDSLWMQSHLVSGGGGGHVSGGWGQFGEPVELLKKSCDLSTNMVSYMNRENIVPKGLECNTVQTAFAPLYSSSHFDGSLCLQKSLYSSLLGGIRSHLFGLGETRNPRGCPYHVKNQRNTHTEMVNPVNTRLDGGPWMGRLQCGLRVSSNITEQGQLTKANYPSSGKPSPNSYLMEAEVEGVERTTDCGLNKQTCLFNVPCGSVENLAYEDPKLKESHQGLHFYAIDNAARFKRTLNEQIDDLMGPVHELHEVPQPTVLDELGNRDIEVDANLMHQDELVNVSGFQKNPGCGNGIGVRCEDKLLAIEKAGSKSSIMCHNSAHTVEGGTSSSLDLSLNSLSLSSFNEMDPPSPSLTAASEALLKPQSKLFEMMDGEHFSSGPQVDKSSEAAPISSFHKPENDDDEKTETKQQESDLSIAEKEKLKCSKINGGIPADLTAFYTNLATKELQTINNSDLEYIKELGSGTYGTVFYGKWKGSDVAIKKIKPRCFTEGSVGEDRLVADFWKEAHTLGQLHHPNIVALYGVVTDGPVTNLATVTEYMVNGSLKQVFRRKDRTIDRRKRLIIAMDAAFGMEYLHGKNIVHFDLKSHNFLVNMKDPQRPVCKIGDLGLSKIKQKTLVSGGVRGTIPWMAPELLNTDSMVTEKVDVYSFGIVMWELLTGEEPYANTRSDDMIGGIIRGTLRPEIPNWCCPAWRSLMERCWSSDPEARPDFSEISKELRAMAATMNVK